jgi:uncharacterized protein YigE (DUF2233 family)
MHIVRRIAFLLAAVTSLTADHNGALAETGSCHSMEFERAEYTICEVDLHKDTVRLYWKRLDGAPYEYLSALPRSLERGVGKLLFAANAGMFDSNLKPVGLYVEQGRELVRANTKSGRGNFHMKPNGATVWGYGGTSVRVNYSLAVPTLNRLVLWIGSHDRCVESDLPIQK